MKTRTDIFKQDGHDDNGSTELLMRLCRAVSHLQAAQDKVIAALRPTHDRILVSEARQFSEGCADELREISEELQGENLQAEAA